MNSQKALLGLVTLSFLIGCYHNWFIVDGKPAPDCLDEVGA